MRQAIARWAFPVSFALALVVPAIATDRARAQSRDEIRQRDEQLYQQYQQGDDNTDAGAPQALAPPAGGGAPAAGGGGGLTAQLLERVNALENEQRELRGRVDELQQQLATTTASLNKQIGDLNFQLQQRGGPGASPAAAAEPSPENAAPAPVPTSALPPRRAARPTAAAEAPHPPRNAADAQYQLGDSYVQQHNFQEAAVAFYGAYTKAPRGPLAPVALYRVGSSMASLGQTGAACEALGKLRTEFPTLHNGVANGAASLRRRLHC